MKLDALKFLETEQRMTKGCSISCFDCDFYRDNNGLDVPCVILRKYNLKRYVEIVEEWDKKYPLKTCAQVFFEKFPDAPRDENNGKSPRPCPDDCFKEVKRLCEYQCVECWDQKAPDEYQDWAD